MRSWPWASSATVSYTHLDVYKRQLLGFGEQDFPGPQAVVFQRGLGDVQHAAAIAEPLAPTTAARYRTGRSAGQKYADEIPGQGKVQGLNRVRSGSYYDEALMPVSYTHLDVYKRQSSSTSPRSR